MKRALLVTRPEHDPTTVYLSKWSEKVIDEAARKKISVIDLWRNKAVRQRTLGTLNKSAPGLVFLNGHGDENSVTGHNKEVILSSTDVSFLKGKIVYARACKSAKILGQRSVGVALSYIGYVEDFVFVRDPLKLSRPLEDETARLFLEPSNYVPISLLKGHTSGEAHKRSIQLFGSKIRDLLVKGPASEDYCAIRWLLWDMECQVCLGKMDATFS